MHSDADAANEKIRQLRAADVVVGYSKSTPKLHLKSINKASILSH